MVTGVFAGMLPTLAASLACLILTSGCVDDGPDENRFFRVPKRDIRDFCCFNTGAAGRGAGAGRDLSSGIDTAVCLVCPGDFGALGALGELLVRGKGTGPEPELAAAALVEDAAAAAACSAGIGGTGGIESFLSLFPPSGREANELLLPVFFASFSAFRFSFSSFSFRLASCFAFASASFLSALALAAAALASVLRLYSAL